MTAAFALQNRTLECGGTARRYLVLSPRSWKTSAARPLLIVLHGGGGSAAFAAKVYGWTELAEQRGFVVAFPEATLESPNIPVSIRDNPRIWNDGSTRSKVAQRNVDDIGYLACVLDDLRSHFSIDSQRVFMTGFSNGASMTLRAGIELSAHLTAIAPVAGHLCLRDPRPARPVSMLYIIGDADPLNPIAGGQVQTPWGEIRRRPAVWDTIETWLNLVQASEVPHTLALGEQESSWKRYGPGDSGREVQFCIVRGQGHEWPGARRTLPQSISGPHVATLDATQAIWNFFVSLKATEPASG